MKYEFKTLIEVSGRYVGDYHKLYIVNAPCNASTAAKRIFGVNARSKNMGIVSEAYVTVDGTGYTISCTPYDAKLENARLVSREYYDRLISEVESAEVLEMLWYACLTDNDDTDWGTGSYDISEAEAWVRDRRDVYPDAYIAVIDGDTCIREIRDI